MSLIRGGKSTAQLNAQYARLDGTNQPFTGDVQAPSFNGVGLTTAGSANNFLAEDGGYYPVSFTETDTLQSVIDRGQTSTKAITLGSSSAPTTTCLTETVPSTYTYTTITGTISSISTNIDDSNVTGSGTAFLTEFEVGDWLVHPILDYVCVQVIRITSNTSMGVLGNTASGYTGANWRRRRAEDKLKTSAGLVTKSTSYGGYNPISGASDLPIHLFRGDFVVQNTQANQSGVRFYSFAGDGRMRLKHLASTAYIEFQGNNAGLGLSRVALSDANWGGFVRLTTTALSTGQNALCLQNTGTGVSKAIQISVESYAQNGVQPAIEMYATTFGFGTRDATWNNYFIGTKTLNMNTAGAWSTELPFKPKQYTVATLPSAATYSGCYATVTDGLSPTYRGVATGGGSEMVLVFSNGTNWLFH